MCNSSINNVPTLAIYFKMNDSIFFMKYENLSRYKRYCSFARKRIEYFDYMRILFLTECVKHAVDKHPLAGIPSIDDSG